MRSSSLRGGFPIGGSVWIRIRTRPSTETDPRQLRNELVRHKGGVARLGKQKAALDEQVRLVRNGPAGHISGMVRFGAADT